LFIAQKSCLGCPKSQPSYDSHTSSSASLLSCSAGGTSCLQPCHTTCNFTALYETCDYTDQSQICGFNGTMFEDVLSFGAGTIPATCAFGGISAHIPGPDDEFVQMAGVWGVNNAPSACPMGLLAAANNVPLMFAFVLGKQSGLLLIGDWLNSSGFFQGPVTWIQPYIPHYSHYDMEVIVHNETLSYNSSQSIPGGIDSGTNTIVMPTETFTQFASVLLSMCSSALHLRGVCDVPYNDSLLVGHCFQLTQHEIEEYPIFSVVLGGTPFPVSPSTYLYERHPGSPMGSRCLGIQSWTGPMLLLGDVFLQDTFAGYDFVNQRIGFAARAN